MHKIAISDKFIYLDTVQYLKKDWNNRNKIKIANGWTWLTVPVYTKGKFNQNLCDTKINKQKNWREKHWKSILLNYKKAEFFNDYKDFFENLYQKKWINLSDINREILKYLMKEIDIKTEWIESKELKLNGKKNDLIIDMCKKTNCSNFVFGKLGRNYADKEKFELEKIKIYFQDYDQPIYKQLWGKFELHMSVIDLLFNYGKKSKKIIMQNNISKKELKEKLNADVAPIG